MRTEAKNKSDKRQAANHKTKIGAHTFLYFENFPKVFFYFNVQIQKINIFLCQWTPSNVDQWTTSSICTRVKWNGNWTNGRVTMKSVLFIWIVCTVTQFRPGGTAICQLNNFDKFVSSDFFKIVCDSFERI